MSNGKEPSLLDVVHDLTVAYEKVVDEGTSLADVAQVARVQPITMVSESLKTYPELWDIEQGILNIYAGYYLQAFSIFEVQMKDSRLISVLDRLNPNRTLKTALVAYESFRPNMYDLLSTSLESEYIENVKKYHCLEGLGFGSKRLNLATESISSTADKALAGIRQEADSDQYGSDGPKGESGGSATISTKASDVFTQSNETVGKVVEVSFSIKDEVVKIPVIMELDLFDVDPDVMVEIMTANPESITLDSRFKDLMAGRISFWSDFVFASDIIQKQEANLIKDKSRAYANMLARITKSKLYGSLTKASSLNTISGIMIISEEEENGIRANLGGGLSNDSTRNKVFANSSVMIIAVVDRDESWVTVYVRNSKTKSRIPVRAFKKGKDSKDSDIIAEIFTSITNNSPISF